ncbi:hypothetical protein SAMN04488084_102656 [Pedobacter antarcticus]|nr:hypothetical protein SAMN04488084_102656 [Pedobacter antarcticus]
MESYFNIYGVLFLLIGVFIRYQIGKHRFNRRNIAGLQIYTSYLKGLITTTIETLLNLLGIFFIVLGLIALIIGY